MSDPVVDTTALSAGDKYERKYLAHLVEVTYTSGNSTLKKWVRLGQDLEEYSVDLNPDVEQKKNILGQSSVNIKGYEPSGSVDTFYAYYGDELFNQLFEAINKRTTGNGLKARVADVLLSGDATVQSSYVEDCYLVPQSIGGEDGVQIPFEIYYAGNRSDYTANTTISNGVITITDPTP